MKRRLVVIGPILIVVFVISVIIALQTPRPAVCTMPLEQIETLKKTGFAVTSVKKAEALMLAADAAADAQDERFSFLRRYDLAQCKDAQEASNAAAAAAVTAQANSIRAAALIHDATGVRDRGQRAITDATLWLQTGVVGESFSTRLSQARTDVEAGARQLARAQGELNGLGFEIPLEELNRVIAVVTAQTAAAEVLNSEVQAAALTACRAKLRGQPVTVDSVRGYRDWLIVRGHSSLVPEATLVLGLDREARRCLTLASVVPNPRILTELPGKIADEELLEWSIPGVMPTKILVGWSKTQAWFVTREGGYRAFLHLANARCRLVEEACRKPQVGAEEIEAVCSCADDVTGSTTVRVRYAWDGRAVIAEL